MACNWPVVSPQHTQRSGFLAYPGFGCWTTGIALRRQRSWQHNDRRKRDHSCRRKPPRHRDDATRGDNIGGLHADEAPRGLCEALGLSKPTESHPEQSSLGDMSAADFRRYGHQVVDWIADYLSHPDQYPVFSRNLPDQLKKAIPPEAPERGEAMEALLEDLDRIVVPGVTHWNHPGFFAYFATSGSAPGILGEMLSAAFNVNAMLWRTSPSATELEEVTLEWLRQLIGLPDSFTGVIYDTASISTLCAIAAAREAAGLNIRELGLTATGARLRIYAS